MASTAATSLTVSASSANDAKPSSTPNTIAARGLTRPRWPRAGGGPRHELVDVAVERVIDRPGAPRRQRAAQAGEGHETERRIAGHVHGGDGREEQERLHLRLGHLQVVGRRPAGRRRASARVRPRLLEPASIRRSPPRCARARARCGGRYAVELQGQAEGGRPEQGAEREVQHDQRFVLVEPDVEGAHEHLEHEHGGHRPGPARPRRRSAGGAARAPRAPARGAWSGT